MHAPWVGLLFHDTAGDILVLLRPGQVLTLIKDLRDSMGEDELAF
jgi:hypothetical protein